MTDAMTTRERFQAVMHFQPFDRLPVLEWATWWHLTINRWHGERLPASANSGVAIARHFGLDVYRQFWLPCSRSTCPRAPSHGAGIIETMDDYERIRPHLFPDGVIDPDEWTYWAGEQREGNVVLWFTLEGFFWGARELLGIERHLYAFYDQPELIHQINRDLADWMLAVVDEILAVCTPDFMTFAEDMSYNHGPMLSEELFDAFVLPYYQRVVPRLQEHGILCIVDSDGDISRPAFWFERAGLDGILPLERQAGVDIAALRREHPRMRFIGQFDKMVMNQGEAAMRAEFERLVPTAAKGGYLISCDHQTPPGVSYDDYQLYLKLFREYAAIAGNASRLPGPTTP
jgi:hypothetical protein